MRPCCAGVRVCGQILGHIAHTHTLTRPGKWKRTTASRASSRVLLLMLWLVHARLYLLCSCKRGEIAFIVLIRVQHRQRGFSEVEYFPHSIYLCRHKIVLGRAIQSTRNRKRVSQVHPSGRYFLAGSPTWANISCFLFVFAVCGCSPLWWLGWNTKTVGAFTHANCPGSASSSSLPPGSPRTDSKSTTVVGFGLARICFAELRRSVGRLQRTVGCHSAPPQAR